LQLLLGQNQLGHPEIAAVPQFIFSRLYGRVPVTSLRQSPPQCHAISLSILCASSAFIEARAFFQWNNWPALGVPHNAIRGWKCGQCRGARLPYRRQQGETGKPSRSPNNVWVDMTTPPGTELQTHEFVPASGRPVGSGRWNRYMEVALTDCTTKQRLMRRWRYPPPAAIWPKPTPSRATAVGSSPTCSGC
jgi:hypothetical protein